MSHYALERLHALLELFHSGRFPPSEIQEAEVFAASITA
jgi:hypothetical protein